MPADCDGKYGTHRRFKDFKSLERCGITLYADFESLLLDESQFCSTCHVVNNGLPRCKCDDGTQEVFENNLDCPTSSENADFSAASGTTVHKHKMFCFGLVAVAADSTVLLQEKYIISKDDEGLSQEKAATFFIDTLLGKCDN